MITHAEFRNFKALRDVKIDLEPFTVLVGPNASGKTSVLQALRLLTEVTPDKATGFFQGEKHPESFFSRSADKPEIELSVNGSFDRLLRFDLTPQSGQTHPGPQLPSHKPGLCWMVWVHGKPDSTNPAWQLLHGTPRHLRGSLSSSLLSLDVTRLAAPSFSDEAEPSIRDDGEGLASALLYMRANQPEVFDRLTESLRKVFPHVQRIRFDRTEIIRDEVTPLKVNDEVIRTHEQRKYWGDRIILDMQGAPNILAGEASDGTLLVLGLLAVIATTQGPHLLLLDDLDHGLHPAAQRDVIELLRALMKDKPDLQIVATTHSPYLLDNFEGKEVRLMTRREDGSVACARLDQHPDFEKWKREMMSGEFWSAVGEKWVGERQPQEAGT
jgi:predicted ATPase